MAYSDADVAEFRKIIDSLPRRRMALGVAYATRGYKTDRAREFATHGLLRRVDTLERCIYQVFDYLPPEMADIPKREPLQNAAIAVQAFVFNVFGCVDNLAWIWACESGVKNKKGDPLRQHEIGLGAKYESLRNSLSADFRALLESRKDWFGVIEGYRHALAHRIPLYIPPHSVLDKNTEAYKALEAKINEAGLKGNRKERERLEAEQMKLAHFTPWIAHSFSERAPLLYLHPQLLTDFATIEEFAVQMLRELEAIKG